MSLQRRSAHCNRNPIWVGKKRKEKRRGGEGARPPCKKSDMQPSSRFPTPRSFLIGKDVEGREAGPPICPTRRKNVITTREGRGGSDERQGLCLRRGVGGREKEKLFFTRQGSIGKSLGLEVRPSRDTPLQERKDWTIALCQEKKSIWGG